MDTIEILQGERAEVETQLNNISKEHKIFSKEMSTNYIPEEEKIIITIVVTYR